MDPLPNIHGPIQLEVRMLRVYYNSGQTAEIVEPVHTHSRIHDMPAASHRFLLTAGSDKGLLLRISLASAILAFSVRPSRLKDFTEPGPLKKETSSTQRFLAVDLLTLQ